jgi:ubiquinone/menaquinone biosynthesis C-methylase UbiE
MMNRFPALNSLKAAPLFLLFFLPGAWTAFPCPFGGGPALVEEESAIPRYEFRTPDPDGIGKIYMGREIARVMGHQGAAWLERPEREQEEKPDLLIEAIRLKPGEQVADIGAGTGYFSWRMARKVGEQGKVYAVDVQQEMLEMLVKSMEKRGLQNIKPVLGSEQSCNLTPNSIDLALMVDVYHEFSHPYEMLESICLAVRPGGRIVFVEYRAEDPLVPIKPLHKMSEAQVKKEASVHPLEHLETISILPRQHIIVFRRQERN